MNKIILALGLLLAGTGVLADTPAAPAAAPAISPQLHDEIIGVVRAQIGSRYSELGEVFANSILQGVLKKHPNITPENQTAIHDAVIKVVNTPENVQKFEESLVTLYATNFSADEIHEITAFSQTSAGKKMLTGFPGKEQIVSSLRPWLITDVFPPAYLQVADILKRQGITLEDPN